MDEYAQLRALLDLAESAGLTLRRAPLPSEQQEHPGGALVKLRGQEILFLDPTAAVADRIAVVAAALKGRQVVEEAFIPPEIREIIDGA